MATLFQWPHGHRIDSIIASDPCSTHLHVTDRRLHRRRHHHHHHRHHRHHHLAPSVHLRGESSFLVEAHALDPPPSLDLALQILVDDPTCVFSVDDYIHLLGECRKRKSFDQSRMLYLHICGNGLETDRKLGNHLVPTLVECGNVCEAHQVFNRLLHHNEHSWTALLHGYAEMEDFGYTLSIWQRMKSSGVYPSCHTFMPLLKVCSMVNHVDEGRNLHHEIVLQGFESDSFLGDTLVDMYAKCGLLVDAQGVFDKIVTRSVVTWTALIAGYTECGFGETALLCLTQMIREGIPPNNITYTLSLKSCVGVEDMSKGQEIHASVIKEGFDSDPFISSAVIDMYISFGSILQAQAVFDEAKVCDLVVWTTIIAGYVEHGLYNEALACFKQMHLMGMVGNRVTFVCIVKACGNLGAISLIEEMHHEIVKLGFEKDPFICSTLTAAYANCKSIKEAHCVFNGLIVRDSVAWAALVSLYTAYGLYEQALHCLEETREDGIIPNAVAYKSFLKSCGIEHAIDNGCRVHSDIVKEGMERDPLVSVALIEMYSKCGNFTEARKMFHSCADQAVCAWAALISGYAEHGLYEETLLCLKEMLIKNVRPDALIFALSLKACSILCDIETGREIHSYIVLDGMEADPSVGTALIDMYADFHSITEVEKLFGMLQDPDVVAWTALISAYAENGLLIEALGYLEQMQFEGVSPDDLTFLCTIKCTSNLRKVHEGQYLHACVVKMGFEQCSLIRSNLVNMYGKSGCLLEAQDVFEKSVVNDTGMWTALLGCYADCGSHKEAIRIYRLMENYGVSPNHTQCSVMLKVCGTLESVELGQEIHSSILMCGLESSNLLVADLMFMYAAFDMAVDAEGVFKKILHSNLQVWNALIHVYVKYGNSEKVYKSLKEMQLEGISPDNITYAHLLRSCNRENRMVRQVHLEITKLGLERDVCIGRALLGMYSQNGSLEEAQVTFDKLSPDDTNLWAALIEGYAYRDMGTEAIHKLTEYMQLEGVLHDSGTLVACLKAYKTIGGSLYKVQDIHNEVLIFGFESNLFIASNLMEIYLRHGLFQDTQRVFDRLGQWSMQPCSALIMAYSELGLWKETLNHLDRMRTAGIDLDARSLVYGLKASGHLEDINTGREFHAEILKIGIEWDPHVNTNLISMYLRCGSLAEAAHLFSKEPSPTIMSWTALISGLVGYGFAEEALGLLDQMYSDGIPPDEINLIQRLEACSMTGDIDKGHQAHIQILQFGLESNPTVGGALLDMYGHCASLLETECVFDRLPTQNVITWAELMFAYVMNGFAGKALQCVDKMKIYGISPDAITFICLLKACVLGGHTMMHALDKIRASHIEVLKFGFDVDTYIESTLIYVYSRCGAFAEANKVFDMIPISNVVAWTALISGYVESGFAEKALSCLLQMHSDNVSPDEFIFSSSLEACNMIGDIENGRRIHIEVVKSGAEQGPIIGGSILNMYANCGPIAETENVFNRMPEQNTIAWTELMFAYVKHMLGDKALHCLDEMQINSISPDAITFHCSLKACVCLREDQDAMHSSTYDAIEMGRELHMEIVKSGFDVDTYVTNCLLDMYCKCGAFADARKVFDDIPAPNIVAWTTLMSGYMDAGFVGKALDCLDEMKSGGVESDEVNLICALEACAAMGDLDKGREIHRELVKFGFEGNPMIGANLLHLYGKHGSIVEAESVFRKLPESDVVTWTALMLAYAKNGLSDEALWCFEQMQKVGIRPDGIASVIGLESCVSIGALDKAQQVHALAVKQGIDKDPIFDNYVVGLC